MQIREIKAEETWELRRSVMWPEKSISYVQLPDDTNGIHFGLYNAGLLVSVISLFLIVNEGQFRKFATLPQQQSKGYGTALLQHLIKHAEAKGVTKLWCNARQGKTAFYRKFGLHETNQIFSKDGKTYVIMEATIGAPLNTEAEATNDTFR